MAFLLSYASGNDGAFMARLAHSFTFVFSSLRDVVDFVAADSSGFNRTQQPATSSPQQVQQESVRINRIQQVSIRYFPWFGTRGSEVQILSPRPIFLDINDLRALA